MVNNLAAVYSAQYFSFAVIVSAIDPTNCKSIKARLYYDEGFREAVRESVRS